MDWVIETRGLTKDFGRGKGLFDLDMRLAPGKVHGFLGPNGAGKTTALRLLMGYLRPTRGASRVLGFDPVTESHRMKAGIGYVPGELALPDMVTGATYWQQSAAMRDAVDEAWRDELVARLRAEPHVKIGKLSKGNKQKIALIDALQHRPPLLMMDEPTDGLDPLLRVEVRSVLRDHVRQGGTVFLSSHVVHEIQTMCDDVLIVLAGHLRKRARMDDLLREEGLRVEARVPDPAEAEPLLRSAGARRWSQDQDRIRFHVHGDVMPALLALHRAGGTVTSLHQGDLEETFLRLFRGHHEAKEPYEGRPGQPGPPGPRGGPSLDPSHDTIDREADR